MKTVLVLCFLITRWRKTQVRRPYTVGTHTNILLACLKCIVSWAGVYYHHRGVNLAQSNSHALVKSTSDVFQMKRTGDFLSQPKPLLDIAKNNIQLLFDTPNQLHTPILLYIVLHYKLVVFLNCRIENLFLIYKLRDETWKGGEYIHCLLLFS